MKTVFSWLKSHARLLVSLTGVALIPLIYAGLLIAANSDPTGRLHDVPALVVNLDTSAKTSTGESIDLGPDIVKELEDSTEASNLHWKQASPADADAALADGSALAVLTVPEGFSAAVASAGDDDAQLARATALEVRTNDASNYLMGTIGKAVGQEVTQSVRAQVSEEYLKNVYVGFSDLHSQLGEAADGAQQLADGSSDAKDGSGQLVVGLKKLADGTVTLDAGAVKLAAGASRLADGAGTLSSGLDELRSKTSGLPRQASDLDAGARQIAKGTSAVNDAASQLKTGAASASKGASTLADGAGQLDTAAGALRDGSAQVAQGTQTLSTAADQVASHVKDISAGTQETLGALGTLIEDTTGLPSSTTVDVSGRADQAVATLKKIAADPAVQAAIQSNPTLAKQFEALQKDLPAVADGAAKTEAAIDRAAKAAGIVKDHQGTSIDDLIADAQKADQAAQGLKTKVGQLNDGAQQVAAGNKALAGKTPALAQGAKDLADGNQQLADGTAKLADSTPTLKDGAAQLSAGTGALKQAVPTLTDAISQAADGGATLASGAQDLKTGANSLTDGASQLKTGAQDASSGSQDLDEGLGQLKDGSKDLSTGLDEGVDAVPNYSAGDRDHLSTVTADPVRLDKASANAMANYGTGLTPYFLSLALWIGGIAFFMLLAPLPARLLARRLPAPLTAARALIPSGIMALVQATIAVGVVLFGLRIEVAQPWTLYGLALFASLTFVWLNQGLVALLGAPGRFLSLIMVVLQVGTAGGTYPWQTLPSPLAWIHPLLPMTYTVQTFRSLVAGGPAIGLGNTVAILSGYLIAGLLLLVLAAFLAPRRARIYDTATLAPGLPGGGRSEGEYSFEHGRAAAHAEPGAPATVPVPDDGGSPSRERVLVGAGAVSRGAEGGAGGAADRVTSAGTERGSATGVDAEHATVGVEDLLVDESDDTIVPGVSDAAAEPTQYVSEEPAQDRTAPGAAQGLSAPDEAPSAASGAATEREANAPADAPVTGSADATATTHEAAEATPEAPRDAREASDADGEAPAVEQEDGPRHRES